MAHMKGGYKSADKPNGGEMGPGNAKGAGMGSVKAMKKEEYKKGWGAAKPASPKSKKY